MNIAIWNPRVGHAIAGGTETFLREMAPRLAESHDVTVYTDIRDGETPPIDGVTCRPVRSRRKEEQCHAERAPWLPAEVESWSMWRAFDGDLREHDVVSTHYYLDALLLGNADVPLVYRYAGIKQPNWRWRLLQAIDPADAYVANSEATADRLAEWYDARPEHVVYAGVDTERFRPRIGGRPRRCLFVGRLDHGKGLFRLLDAVATLPRASLRIVGEGILRDELEARVAELGMADRVTFAGRVPHEQMPTEYDRAGVLVHPSDHEGFPVVVLEAMATGTPVVASDIDAIREQVTDRETGLLVDGQSVEAIREAVKDLLIHPRWRWDMAAAVRETALAYDWDSQADQLEAVYREVA